MRIDRPQARLSPQLLMPYSGPASDRTTRKDSSGPTFVVSSKDLRAYALAKARCFRLSRHRGRFACALVGSNSETVLVREGWLRFVPLVRAKMCLT